MSNRLVGRLVDPDGARQQGVSEEYYGYEQTPFSTRADSPFLCGRGSGAAGGQMLFRFTGPELEDLANRYLRAPVVDVLLSDEKLTAPDEPGEIYWGLGDNLDTVRDIARYDPLTDTTTIVKRRTFDTFGNMTSETNPAAHLLFALTGRMFDRSTGLRNNLHRWCDRTTGRWLSEDLTGFPANGLNLYRYGRKDQLTGRDSVGAGCMAGAPVASPLRPGDF